MPRDSEVDKRGAVVGVDNIARLVRRALRAFEQLKKVAEEARQEAAELPEPEAS